MGFNKVEKLISFNADFVKYIILWRSKELGSVIPKIMEDLI